MRAAKITEHPGFALMRQTDIQNIYHMQMPRWLFSDPRYADMGLDAKIVYTFLLNRFQLSRRNGWTNDLGEIFVIYPRRELAGELRICEQRVTAAFRTLASLKLIWEKRCGRGEANQIYLALIDPLVDPDCSSAPFLSEQQVHDSVRTAGSEVLDRQDPAAHLQGPQDTPSKNSNDRGPWTAGSAAAGPQDLRPSNKELSHTEKSSPSVGRSVSTDEQTGAGEEQLEDILAACELDTFEPETARVFENAIERLFYADSFRVGNSTLPQDRVRAKLRCLNMMILRDAEQKLYANMVNEVRNSTAYVMTTVFNCISESASDLMVDPYLNSLRVISGKEAG